MFSTNKCRMSLLVGMVMLEIIVCLVSVGVHAKQWNCEDVRGNRKWRRSQGKSWNNFIPFPGDLTVHFLFSSLSSHRSTSCHCRQQAQRWSQNHQVHRELHQIGRWVAFQEEQQRWTQSSHLPATVNVPIACGQSRSGTGRSRVQHQFGTSGTVTFLPLDGWVPSLAQAIPIGAGQRTGIGEWTVRTGSIRISVVAHHGQSNSSSKATAAAKVTRPFPANSIKFVYFSINHMFPYFCYSRTLTNLIICCIFEHSFNASKYSSRSRKNTYSYSSTQKKSPTILGLQNDDIKQNNSNYWKNMERSLCCSKRMTTISIHTMQSCSILLLK